LASDPIDPVPGASPNARINAFAIDRDGQVLSRLSDNTVFTLGRIIVPQLEQPEQLVPTGDIIFLPPTTPVAELVTPKIQSGALDFNQITHAVLANWRKQTREIQGRIMAMDAPAFLAIAGNGWFVIRDPLSGRRLYTRVGMFGWTTDGYLETFQGWRVQAKPRSPLITTPPTPNDVRPVDSRDLRLPLDADGAFSDQWYVDMEGQVSTPDADGNWTARAEICLARVRDVTELVEFSPYHFTLDGEVTLASPADEGLGRLVPGALENVWDWEAYVPKAAPPKGIFISAWGLVGRTADIVNCADLGIWTLSQANGFPFGVPLNSQITVGRLEYGRSIMFGTDEIGPTVFYRLRVR
jgi:flagellar basal body rod protein FlgG